MLATATSPDWAKVKAEGDKALALDPNNGRADYILGVAAANQKDPKTALDYMNKAKASPAYGSDAALAKQIDAALKQLNTPDNGGPLIAPSWDEESAGHGITHASSSAGNFPIGFLLPDSQTPKRTNLVS